jgi:hypothetical protein
MSDLELVGRIIKKEIKDVGKGKDAEAHEVLVVTAKLDNADGIRGSLYFVPGEHADSFDLGDPVTVTIEQRQGKLPLRAQTARAGH